MASGPLLSCHLFYGIAFLTLEYPLSENFILEMKILPYFPDLTSCQKISSFSCKRYVIKLHFYFYFLISFYKYYVEKKNHNQKL